MTDNVVLEPITAGAEVEIGVRPVSGGGILPVTVAASPLTGAEVIPILFSAGDTWVASGYELSVTNPVQVIEGLGRWKLVKPVTTELVGVYVSGAGSQFATVVA